jgi:hypothetical protein
VNTTKVQGVPQSNAEDANVSESFELHILRAFAAAGPLPKSRHEALGSGPAVARQNEAIEALAARGLLADSGTRDHFWAVRYRVTAAGYKALGLPLPSATPARAGRVPAASANGSGNGRKRRAS